MKSKSLIETLFLCSVLLFSTLSCSKDDDDMAQDATISVTTLSANPTLMSATVSVQISAPGLSFKDFDEIGVFYSTNSKVTSKDSKAKANSDNLDSITVRIPYLSPNTKYYYKAYVIKGGVMTMGNTRDFTTLNPDNIIITGSYDKDTHHATATLNCQGFEDEITEVGFCYTYKSGTDPKEDTDSKVVDSLYSKGTSIDIEILNVPFNKIYYRSFVKVNGYAIYGQTKSGDGNHMISSGDIDTETYSMSGCLAFSTGYTGLKTGICYSKSNREPNIKDDRITYNSVLDSLNGSFVATFPQVPFGTVYCRPFAQLGEQVLYGDVKSFFRRMPVGKPVDLGLSVLWADMNLGAEKPEDNGLYYDWGGTEDKDRYTEQTMSYVTSSPDYPGSLFITKYTHNEDYMIPGSTPDGKTVLEPEDDAATFNWQGTWRTPTVEEYQELIDNCKLEWIADIYCFKFTGPNGNSILMPGSGYAYDYHFYQNKSYAYYQTSTRYPSYDVACWAVYMRSSSLSTIITTDGNGNIISQTTTGSPEPYAELYEDGRYYGRTVRPVCPKE